MSDVETLHERCLQLYLVVLISGMDKTYKSLVGILDFLVVNTTGYSLQTVSNIFLQLERNSVNTDEI